MKLACDRSPKKEKWVILALSSHTDAIDSTQFKNKYCLE